MPYSDRLKRNAATRKCARKRRARHRRLGLCIQCPAKAAKGHTSCDQCLEDQRMRMNLREAKD